MNFHQYNQTEVALLRGLNLLKVRFKESAKETSMKSDYCKLYKDFVKNQGLKPFFIIINKKEILSFTKYIEFNIFIQGTYIFHTMLRKDIEILRAAKLEELKEKEQLEFIF